MCPYSAVAHSLDDGLGINALVHVQRDGGHLKGGMLGLARPLEGRVEVRVVGIGFLARVLIGRRRNQPDRRIVLALLVGWSYCEMSLLALPCRAITASTRPVTASR